MITPLIKRIIRGTVHGRFELKYLQKYLDEYIFPFNRGKSQNIGTKLVRLIQQIVKSAKVTYSEIM